MREGFKDIRTNGFDDPKLFQAAWLEENTVMMKDYDCIPNRKVW